MVLAAQAETSPWISHARQHLPPEIVSPAVAFLAHESCPITGECIESMGGHISRMYLARTKGFDAPDMTIETLAERWQEAMTGADEGIFRHTDADPREWHIKPYVPVG
jgi:hypothetical protein